MKKPHAIKPCVDCGTLVAIHHHLQTRCKRCRTRFRNTRPKTYNKVCNRCGRDFKPRNNRAQSCPACQREFPCRICGKPARRTSASSLHCSVSCRDRSKLVAKHGGAYLEALRRDNFKCVKCGEERSPHVHHIDGAGIGHEPECRNGDINNLITLCNSCHGKIHGLTARTLYAKHPDTVREVLETFLHSS